MIYRDRKSSIDAAFHKLEQAAKEKEEELRKSMSTPAAQFSPLMDRMVSDAFKRLTATFPVLNYIVKDGQKISHQVVTNVKREADRRPWMLLGKVALCSFGVGLVIGSYYKRPSRRLEKSQKQRLREYT